MVLFLLTGGVYYGVAHTRGAPATVVCVAICHFFFNFGANSLTFIIPAEIFPTTYRCTCHGISAAAGKIGSMVAIVTVFGINSGYASATRQGLSFMLFSVFMLLGAVCSWAYLPNIQRWTVDAAAAAPATEEERGGASSRVGNKPRLQTKNLEDLGEGRERARRDGEVITVREKVAQVRRRRRRRPGEMPAYVAEGPGVYAFRGQDIGMR